MEAYNEFCLKDHLDNPRIRFADKNMDGRLEHNLQDSCKNEIFGTNHYYPFGMETEGPWYLQRTGVQNHYRYNGKENIGAIGLLDYGARNYDSSIGRFLSVDPLADQYAQISPYAYVANNPIIFIDPDGMQIGDGKDTFTKFKNNVSDKKDYHNNRAESLRNEAISAEAEGNSRKAARKNRRAETASSSAAFYEEVLGELNALEKSDQVYNINTSSSDVGKNSNGILNLIQLLVLST